MGFFLYAQSLKLDLNEFTPGKTLNVEFAHADGTSDTIELNHTYNQSQIDWYNEGSALNLIKKEMKKWC